MPEPMKPPAHRPIVLVLLGACWPGHDASGPNQSFFSMARGLGDEFEFRLVARDRPFGADKAMFESGRWIDTEFGKARYCPPTMFGAAGLKEILSTTDYAVLILNGFFDADFTIPALILRRMQQVDRRPVILSPRGEFSPGAISLKSFKKRAFMKAVLLFGLLDGIWLHATADMECKDIRREIPWHEKIVIAPNVRLLKDLPEEMGRVEPSRFDLRLVAVSRIDRMKNFDFAIKILKNLPFKVQYDIYGPVTDEAYWSECRELIATLPSRIEVRGMGVIPHAEITSVLAAYDGFFLPTRGENFGHSIVDALEAGLPTIISDQTPWQSLEQDKAGWSLPLASPQDFVAAIEHLIAMKPVQRLRLRQGARRLAEKIIVGNDALTRNRSIIVDSINNNSV